MKLADEWCDHRVAKMGTHQVSESQFSSMAKQWVCFSAKNGLTNISRSTFHYYPKFEINACCSSCGEVFDREKYVSDLKHLKQLYGKWT